MKPLLTVLGVGVLLFVGFPLAVRIHDWCGAEVLALVTLFCGVAAAWCGHTADSAAFAEDFLGALRDIGVSQKEAAITMGINEPALANQLSGREQLSAWRMASLGSAFRVALAKRQLAREDAGIVLESQALCDLVNAVQTLTAEQRRPRMLTANLRSEVA